MSRDGSNGCDGEPILTSPDSYGWSPARILSSVVLPQPEGPTSDELARLHVEGRFGNGKQACAARAVGLLHAGEVDERFAHGFGRGEAHEMRASRGTSMCSSASTIP
jgi:hypothetical protein